MAVDSRHYGRPHPEVARRERHCVCRRRVGDGAVTPPHCPLPLRDTPGSPQQAATNHITLSINNLNPYVNLSKVELTFLFMTTYYILYVTFQVLQVINIFKGF